MCVQEAQERTYRSTFSPSLKSDFHCFNSPRFAVVCVSSPCLAHTMLLSRAAAMRACIVPRRSTTSRAPRSFGMGAAAARCALLRGVSSVSSDVTSPVGPCPAAAVVVVLCTWHCSKSTFDVLDVQHHNFAAACSEDLIDIGVDAKSPVYEIAFGRDDGATVCFLR